MLEIWKQLKAAEAAVKAAVAVAEKAHADAIAANKPGEEVAKLHPGPQQNMLSTVRTAITLAERILGPKAVSQARQDQSAVTTVDVKLAQTPPSAPPGKS
jgi:hypothetical protein